MTPWITGDDYPRAVRVRRSALAPPLVSFVGPRLWRLDRAYTHHGAGVTLTVPEGFPFDLASVPRAVWSLIAPFDLSIAAPLLHDFLYRHGGHPPPGAADPPRTWTRAEADRLFADVMALEGVTAWRRHSAWVGVRLGAGFAWRTPQ